MLLRRARRLPGRGVRGQDRGHRHRDRGRRCATEQHRSRPPDRRVDSGGPAGGPALDPHPFGVSPEYVRAPQNRRGTGPPVQTEETMEIRTSLLELP